MRKSFKLAIMIVLVVLLATMTFAKTYKLKFSWVDPFDPKGHSTSSYAVVFKSELERLSGGQIKVELYPAGQLADQRSSVEQVRQGTIEACNISSGVLASLYYEPLGIFDMPFIFSSREISARVLDTANPFTNQLVNECIDKTGIRILNLVPFGFRHLTNNQKPIKSPANMEGMKIRTMEIVPHMKLIEALGASPVPIPFLELYTSLQTKVVDGQENTPQNIMSQKFYQVQKYVTLTGHVMGVGATLINEKWYQKLPDNLKAALIEADRVAQMAYNGVGQLIDTMAVEDLRDHGMNVYAPTPDEMKQFKDLAIPYVRTWMEEKMGKELVANFMNAVSEVEKEIAEEATK